MGNFNAVYVNGTNISVSAPMGYFDAMLAAAWDELLVFQQIDKETRFRGNQNSLLLFYYVTYRRFGYFIPRLTGILPSLNHKVLS